LLEPLLPPEEDAIPVRALAVLASPAGTTPSRAEITTTFARSGAVASASAPDFVNTHRASQAVPVEPRPRQPRL